MNKKGVLQTLVKVVVSLTILFLLFRKCDWPVLWNTLQRVDLWLLALAFVTAIASHLIAVLRWKLVCPKAKSWVLLKLIYVSRLFSTILPGQLFGEASKVVYLSAQMKRYQVVINPEETASGVVIDKLTGLIGLLLVGAGGALARYEVHKQNMLLAFIICAIILTVLVFLPAVPAVARLYEKMLRLIENRIQKSAGVVNRLRGFLIVWKEFIKRPGRVTLSIFLGIVFQLLAALFSMLCGQSLGIAVAFADWCWIIAILSIVLLLPVSYAGLGVREATLVGFLASLGVANEAALGCSLLMLLLQVVDALIGGVFLLTGRGAQRNASQ